MRNFFIFIFILILTNGCAGSRLSYFNEEIKYEKIQSRKFYLVEVEPIPFSDHEYYMHAEIAVPYPELEDITQSLEYDRAASTDFKKFADQNGYVGYFTVDSFYNPSGSGMKNPSGWGYYMTYKLRFAKTSEELKRLKDFYRK